MVEAANLKHSFTYGGATINIFHANKGEGLPMHNHKYSHATTCLHGSCKYTCNGDVLIADKDTTPVNLGAGLSHEIEALEDGTIFMNVFAEGKY
jgi:quercetin dioxygenase-like cupin family protein